MTLRIAIVGLGKIARDQHVPSIAAVEGVELTAVASRNAELPGVLNVATIDDLLGNADAFDAVALCTPPQGRHAQAWKALAAGKHVLLEKPPGATVAEIASLERLARDNDVSLFATWHSRFSAAVEPARLFLAGTQIRSVRVLWKEDVRKWHPGQAWIWEPGGLGVFDPGINALSIVTAILPEAIFLDRSDLFFPANRAAPIAANLGFSSPSGLPVSAEFDWRVTGGETWTIEVETADGLLRIQDGGRRLDLDGRSMTDEPDREYQGIYARFRDLCAVRTMDVDLSPLQLVADGFLLGRRHEVEAFHEEPAR
ncbi:Gfo/Idh/MocA family protein [Aureimonas sp. AU4]|uniref:Gfo/Idh/MocA family protein n=1 Tax=Aureimonas sp. AU4 TaxID=1638163 RepID=UPI000B20D43F